MRKGLLFLTVAILFVVGAAWHGGAWWIGVWPAMSFGWIGAAYLGAGPAVFGKRQDGVLPAGRVLVLLPFLAYQWGVWSLLRLVLPEPACHQLLPDIWIGRRLLSHEVPADIERVLDLTAEFVAPGGVRRGREYVCRPLLDATAPSPEVLRDWVEELFRQPGRLYIHCAQGHGRTGLLAAAMLLRRGIATDASDAVARVRSIRAGVRLNGEQRRCLQAYAEMLRGGSST